MVETSAVPQIGITEIVIQDLEASGLEPKDIGARSIGPAEMAATKTQSIGGRPPIGYVIPYFNLQGDAVKFYRLRILESPTTVDLVKYRQPAGEPNHIYFPIGLKKLIDSKAKPYVIVTEGEKKAACAVKRGYPAIGVSGVDSWRTRRITLPKDTKLLQKGSGELTAQIPKGTNQEVLTEGAGALAQGLMDFMDYCVQQKLIVLIIYDTDDGVVKLEVQRAAATLGYEFRYRGVPLTKIRQVVLPGSKKMGLDDFLMKRGNEELDSLIRACLKKRTAFPRHPNPIAYIGSRMQKKQLTRKETQDVSLAILAELEARGRRFRTSGSDLLHYFDESTRTLYPVQRNNLRVPLHETAFGAYLYQEFNLGGADKRVIDWLATQFSGEPPIDETETFQVLAHVRTPGLRGSIAIQTGDSHFVIVTPNADEPILLCQNGTHGILFEQGQVSEVNPKEVEAQFYRHHDEPRMLWLEIFKQLKVKPSLDGDGNERATRDQMRQLVALLYYISPWLIRWQGTQLPIELVIGEAGSGKSSVLSLRQRIITGKSYLSNMTADIKDWYAGITSRGGVYVLDNVHFTGKKADFRQQLSDEICRLITEPDPHVEMRKLYTNNTVISLPVRSTFAVTSIEQPFYNSDLLQRAAAFELEAIQSGHDSDWITRQLTLGGGRAGWLAHHLVAIHKFLKLAIGAEQWDNNYPAHHRLANYEQCLMLMARAFNMDGRWIPQALVSTTEGQITEADWVFRALRTFVIAQKEESPKEYFKQRWAVSEISEWMETEDAFSKNDLLTNAWRLGRYMQSHKQQLEKSIKLFQAGKKANKYIYGIYEHD